MHIRSDRLISIYRITEVLLEQYGNGVFSSSNGGIKHETYDIKKAEYLQTIIILWEFPRNLCSM